MDLATTKANAKELEVDDGTNLDHVIYLLDNAKKYGDNIFIDFNGHKLYSADFTPDSVCMDVLGCHKEEYLNYVLTEKKRQEAEHEKALKNAVAKISFWDSVGKKYIYEDSLNEWRICVRAKAVGLYTGLDLDYFITVSEAIESGKILNKCDVDKILDSYMLPDDCYESVRYMLREFNPKYNALSYHSSSQLDEKII